MATWRDAWHSQAQPPSLISLLPPPLRPLWQALAWRGKLPPASHCWRFLGRAGTASLCGKVLKGRALLGLLSSSWTLCFWVGASLFSFSSLLLGLCQPRTVLPTAHPPVFLPVLLLVPLFLSHCLSRSVWLLMHHLQVGPASENGAGSESPTAGHLEDPSMLRERTTLYRGSCAEKLWLPPPPRQ